MPDVTSSVHMWRLCVKEAFFNTSPSAGASSGTYKTQLSDNSLSEVEYLNIWCFSFPVSASPFSNNQAANINYDKCNWIVFKCLFHIGNWIKLQTSYFDPRLSKGTNPLLKSMKFCHRFQQYHNFTSEALLCIFLNAPFTLAVPSKFLERFNKCSHHSEGSCTRSPRSVFAPGGRGLCEAGWCSAKESQVWSLLKLPPALLEVY